MIDYIINSQVILYSLIFIAVCAFLWHFVEARWDHRNFDKDKRGVFENLHVRMALFAYDNVDGIVPVDVRSKKEFSEEHIPRAINAEFHEKHFENQEALEALGPDTPILVYCDGGFSSRRALPPLKDMGFHTIYHIHRGFKSWKFFGGEVEGGD